MHAAHRAEPGRASRPQYAHLPSAIRATRRPARRSRQAAQRGCRPAARPHSMHSPRDTRSRYRSSARAASQARHHDLRPDALPLRTPNVASGLSCSQRGHVLALPTRTPHHPDSPVLTGGRRICGRRPRPSGRALVVRLHTRGADDANTRRARARLVRAPPRPKDEDAGHHEKSHAGGFEDQHGSPPRMGRLFRACVGAGPSLRFLFVRRR
jgi:hypothetical protein